MPLGANVRVARLWSSKFPVGSVVRVEWDHEGYKPEFNQRLAYRGTVMEYEKDGWMRLFDYDTGYWFVAPCARLALSFKGGS